MATYFILRTMDWVVLARSHVLFYHSIIELSGILLPPAKGWHTILIVSYSSTIGVLIYASASYDPETSTAIAQGQKSFFAHGANSTYIFWRMFRFRVFSCLYVGPKCGCFSTWWELIFYSTDTWSGIILKNIILSTCNYVIFAEKYENIGFSAGKKIFYPAVGKQPLCAPLWGARKLKSRACVTKKSYIKKWKLIGKLRKSRLLVKIKM